VLDTSLLSGNFAFIFNGLSPGLFFSFPTMPYLVIWQAFYFTLSRIQPITEVDAIILVLISSKEVRAVQLT
jgi:hypothetical protein